MMTARPMYQWKSFWLGVVMLVFLGWAWQQAMRMNQWARVDTPGIAVGINQYEGQAGVFVAFVKEKWDISRGAIPRKDVVLFPELGTVSLSQMNGPYHPLWQFRARFAHWFLMLAVVVGWTAWLAWKWKRVQRSIA